MDQAEVVSVFKVFFNVLRCFAIQPINLSATNSSMLKIRYFAWSSLHIILFSVLMIVMLEIKNTVFFDADNLGQMIDLFRSFVLFVTHFFVVLEVVWYHDEFITMFEHLKDIEKIFKESFKYLVNVHEEYKKLYLLLRNLSFGFLIYYISVELNAMLSCDACWNNIVVFFIPQIMIFIKQLQYWIYVKLLTIYLIKIEEILKEIVKYYGYNHWLKSLNYDKLIRKKLVTIKVIYSNIQNINVIINKIFGLTQLIFAFKVNLWILMDLYWVVMNLNSPCN